MRFLLLIPIAFCLISFVSCQKENNDTDLGEHESDKGIYTKDSIFFTLDGKEYSSTELYGAGVGNKQINIQPFSNEIAGRDYAYSTGGYWWYGERDSLLFEQLFRFRDDEFLNISLGFSKKYHKSDLVEKSNYMAPKDYEPLFEVGETSFATDYNMENTREGVSIEVSSPQGELTSYIPGFSILIRSDLTNDLQDNSTFEIIKVENIKQDKYLVEARFEANVYASDERVYRIKNGFVRFKTRLERF